MLTPTNAVFSVLLVVTGISKLRRPDEVYGALAALGLPTFRHAGVALGAVELGVGALALAFSGIVLLVQGLLYLAFTIWVIAAIRSSTPLATCGCLGRADTPPYWGHLTVDVVGASLSGWAGLMGATPLVIDFALEGIALLSVIGVGAFLSWLIIDHGARLYGLRQG